MRSLVPRAALVSCLVLACGSGTTKGGRDASDAGGDRGAGGGIGTGDASPEGGDGASCKPLDTCACSDAGGCGACIQTACLPPSAICADLQNGTCECGIALVDDCVKPQSHCLCPACGDGSGLCVTDGEQATLCAGSFRSSFACP